MLVWLCYVHRLSSAVEISRRNYNSPLLFPRPCASDATRARFIGLELKKTHDRRAARLNVFPSENKIEFTFFFSHRVYTGHLERFPDLAVLYYVIITYIFYPFRCCTKTSSLLRLTRPDAREHNHDRQCLSLTPTYLGPSQTVILSIGPSTLLWYRLVRRIGESQNAFSVQ